MVIHNFGSKYREGVLHEREIDSQFHDRFEISAVPRFMQRLGVDRIWKNRESGETFTVEYKADEVASRTGNVFIETTSIDTEKKPGWAYTSTAQILVYYIPGDAIYLASTLRLRRVIKDWVRRYPTGRANNGTYFSQGILVPTSVFARIATRMRLS